MSKRVTVIMSAYNGEQFIREQIGSVLGQTWPEITLYIRDDGSTDGTWDILKEYARRYGGSVICRRGQNKGFIRSFFKAMRDCPAADYYAWCDQDDIWEPGKIQRAVERLAAHEGGADKPLLYFTDYDFYDAQMRFVGHGLVHKRGTSFANSLMDCIPLGFNSVFNDTARRMMLESMPRCSCGHDWWTYMVCAAFGEVIYDKGYVSVKYRRLETSVSPGGRSFISQQIWRFKKFFANDYFAKIRLQLREFAYLYLQELEETDPEKARVLSLFAHKRYTPVRALQKAFYPAWFRQGLTEELMVRVLFLMGRL